MTYTQAVIIAVIEGLTEFLPVSSTGHMILASAAMRMEETEFLKTFEISIQLGAIMAVVAVYFRRFLVSTDIYTRLIIAFIPTAIAGKLAYQSIKAYLFNPFVVSAALIIGGIVLILLDRWSERRTSKVESVEKMNYGMALWIGLFQCVSMVPGVSRAAATIFGGIFSGLDRKQAAEFSFLLAVPTMMAATGYDLYKTKAVIGNDEWQLLAVGMIVAFVFALLVVKTFIAFIGRYGFRHFGYYRIILGLVFLAAVLLLDIPMHP